MDMREVRENVERFEEWCESHGGAVDPDRQVVNQESFASTCEIPSGRVHNRRFVHFHGPDPDNGNEVVFELREGGDEHAHLSTDLENLDWGAYGSLDVEVDRFNHVDVGELMD
jgi:hypothetical protein